MGVIFTDYSELDRLAREIRDGHDVTSKYIGLTKENRQNALREAILTGRALAKVRQIIGRAKFERWLKVHCKGLSDAAYSHYLSLAKSPPNDLQKAFQKLEIASEDTGTGTATTPTEKGDT